MTLELAPLSEDANFYGHFPGCPILPGIVQVAWVVHFAALHLGAGATYRELASIKFQRLVQPGMKLVIEIDLDAGNGTLRFRLLDASGTLSSGTLRP